MTPDALASLHAAAFTLERPWSAAEFADLLASEHTHLASHPNGFALFRTLAGESELLTLAVDPRAHRQGIGRALMHDWLTELQNKATRAFLEVASDNTPALALYRDLGFQQVGLRRAYYLRKALPAADAIVMQYDLTCGQPPDLQSDQTESG